MIPSDSNSTLLRIDISNWNDNDPKVDADGEIVELRNTMDDTEVRSEVTENWIVILAIHATLNQPG